MLIYNKYVNWSHLLIVYLDNLWLHQFFIFLFYQILRLLNSSIIMELSISHNSFNFALCVLKLCYGIYTYFKILYFLDSIFILKISSLLLVMLLALEPAWPDSNINISILQLMYIWPIFFHSFAFNLSMA